MVLAIDGVEPELDDDDDLELPRWMQFLLETGFHLWLRLQKGLGR
jgi:hypothetical protein